MELIICQDSSEVVEKANAWCRQHILKLKARSIFLPAGQTPLILYKNWEANRPSFLKNLRFVQIDDVISGDQAGVFKKFFQKTLPSYSEHFQWINDHLHQADLSVLGLGLNGHVAFHEPGLPQNFNFGCVKLSDKTREQLKLAPNSWGVSYGVDAFMKSKAVLMIATGANKKGIVKKLLNNEGQFPALWLRQHNDFTLLVDEAACDKSTLKMV